MRKNLLYIFVAVAAVLAISCQKEKDTYVPAEPVSGAQYFFPSSSETSFKLAEGLTSIELKVGRVAKDLVSVAKIAVTDTSKTVYGQGTGNLEAAFKAGEKESTITLPIDMSKYEYGDLYGLDLTITEESTPYGTSSLHIEINYPEPWVKLGTGTYIDDVVCGLYGIDPITVPCTIWANEAKPGLYKMEDFQLPLVAAIFEVDESELPEGENWKNVSMLIDATNPEDVRINYAENYGVCLNAGDGFIDGVTNVYNGEPFSVGTLKDGIITFPTPKGMLCTLNGAGWYYAGQHGKFTIALPGVVIADYSTKIEFSGLYAKKDGTVVAMADVTLGADVVEALVAIAPGEDPADAFSLILEDDESVISVTASGEIQIPLPEELSETYSIVIAPLVDGEVFDDEATYDTFEFKDFSISVVASEPVINDDEVTATLTAGFIWGADVEYAKVTIFDCASKDITADDLAIFDDETSGDVVLLKHSDDEVSFQLDEEGTYTIVALSYGMGKDWNYGVKEVEFKLVDPWEAMGYILYTDNVLTTWWGGEPIQYYVPIEKNNEVDGLFRLVDVYTKYHPWNEGTEYDPTQTYYSVVDATDPDTVLIPVSSTGCDWGYGIMSFGSLGAYYLDVYTRDVIIAQVGDIFGKYKDGVISFPGSAMFMIDDDLSPTFGNKAGWSMDLNAIVNEIPADAPAHIGVKSVKRSQDSSIISRNNSAVSVARGRVKAAHRNLGLVKEIAIAR